MSYWLKLIGASEAGFELSAQPFDDETRKELETEVRFPRGKAPAQVAGDDLIYYAVGFQRIFAHTRVDGPVKQDAPHESSDIQKRFPDAAPIQLGPHVRDLRNAPSLREVAGELHEEIHQGVTIVPMGRPQFDRAISAIRRAVADEKARDQTLARQRG